MSEPGTAGARVVLHTRPGCHLCDVAREVVTAVCADEGTAWTEVDVDAPGAVADGVRDRYTDLVPVVTVDGRHHEHWRIDPERLRAALRERAAAGG
ncbi:MAG: Glutaredoxin-like domain-containing protein PA3033 [uncultured Quadrisphaera sp.]|uniref:Glutaredoxin-like domain-containing protein PA3033 n=1 Tax=uncultured Quadrisphaera sp. TaxID=904978 RepID=A0A6J4NY76_9ACTN|nr:MAG: Glutaredoxin-like domain-containing protein PA3033 [uncultured Quadrisphaera sp.]